MVILPEEFNLVPYEPPQKSLRVFKVGDCYFIGHDAEECLEASESFLGDDLNEVYEVSETDMRRLRLYDEDDDVSRTFSCQFDIEKLRGGDFPRLFCWEE